MVAQAAAACHYSRVKSGPCAAAAAAAAAAAGEGAVAGSVEGIE